MKWKFIFLFSFLLVQQICYSQYIGVKALYTETRLVDDSPNPPKRENRLILRFYEVAADGTYTPTWLSNYDIYIYKPGLQYGNIMGGVLDSTGNNYPGYSWPAPKAVSYFNTLGLTYIDCNPSVVTHYVVNGHELDCGFITVSFWDTDWGTGLPIECFPAPNICLPYYQWPHPYAFVPGNLNFYWPEPPAAPYNNYNFSCGGPLQLVMRGVLPHDSSVINSGLPVHFAGVEAKLVSGRKVQINWANLTESDISHYLVQRSLSGEFFTVIDSVAPKKNNGEKAEYTVFTLQTDPRALYRIRAVERSGETVYSPTLSISIPDPFKAKEQQLQVFPNPVTGTLFSYQLPDAEEARYVITLVDPQGKAVRHKMMAHRGGDLVGQMDLGGLGPGIYRLILYTHKKRFTQSFLYAR